MTEQVILVDSQDQEIGYAEKLIAHKNNWLHRAFSIFIFQLNAPPTLLLQQRALSKYHSGGLWSNTCCSHPRAKEEIVAAGQRRLQEEMGIDTELIQAGWFHYNVRFSNDLYENEIDHVLIGTISRDTKIVLNEQEVAHYQWEPLQKIQTELREQPSQFTPWFAQALKIALEGHKAIL